VRPPRPGAGAASPPAPPSPRLTIIALGAALAWAAALPALLPRTAAHHPGAAAAVLWSSVPHTAAAAAFLVLVLLRQGRWYRPWQSVLLIALSGLYLAGCLALVAAVPSGDARAR
jgi:hypothetical protein